MVSVVVVGSEGCIGVGSDNVLKISTIIGSGVLVVITEELPERLIILCSLKNSMVLHNFTCTE